MRSERDGECAGAAMTLAFALVFALAGCASAPTPVQTTTLTTRAPADLLLKLADLPPGWTQKSPAEFASPSQLIDQTVRVWNSTAEARAHYANQSSTVKAKQTTEARAIGDDALSWDPSKRAQELHLLILKGNVVWELKSVAPYGTHAPTIDHLGAALVAKY